MKHLKINIPEGYEIDKAQSTFENIVFKPTVTALPKTWKELDRIEGYWANGFSRVENTGLADIRCLDINRNIFATKEQAEASIALAQLSQLIQVYNDGWVPDWNDGEYKFNIEYYECKLSIEQRSSYSSFLAFETKELAETFLNNFKDLITIAKPLL
jgi:hypothetical protein